MWRVNGKGCSLKDSNNLMLQGFAHGNLEMNVNHRKCRANVGVRWQRLVKVGEELSMGKAFPCYRELLPTPSKESQHSRRACKDFLTRTVTLVVVAA